MPLNGTHPTRQLAWQRFSHIDGFIQPWTAAGVLSPGLRFFGGKHGACFNGSEDVPLRSAMTCQTAAYERYAPCFPQSRPWRVGDVAACGGLGNTKFVRWTITGGDDSDPPLLVPWHRIGDIGLGEPKARVLQVYGAQPKLGYALHGGKVQVGYDRGRVDSIWFATPYYRTRDGFGVGSRIPPGHTWHGFVWNAWAREKPCSCWVKVGTGPRSLPATTKNFLKPWFFIDIRHGRVASFYFASRFVD